MTVGTGGAEGKRSGGRGQGRVMSLMVTDDGTVDLRPGPAFGPEHSDLADDLVAAVRRVVDAYDDGDGLRAGDS